MTKSLSELIDVAFNVKVYLKVGSYELHQYEDGSSVYIVVQQIPDVKHLLEITKGLDVRLLHDQRGIIVRILENYSE